MTPTTTTKFGKLSSLREKVGRFCAEAYEVWHLFTEPWRRIPPDMRYPFFPVPIIVGIAVEFLALPNYAQGHFPAWLGYVLFAATLSFALWYVWMVGALRSLPPALPRGEPSPPRPW